jgi:hypothetical protein
MRCDPAPRSRLSLLLAATALIGAAGCCGPELRLADMHAKSLTSPYDTLDYFRAAIRFDDLDALWPTLSPHSQEEIAKLAKVPIFVFEGLFASYIRDLRMRDLYEGTTPPAEYADLRVIDLIHRAQISSIERDRRRPGELVWVQLYLRIGEKPIPTSETLIPLIRVPGGKPGVRARWTVGVIEWREWR